MKSTSGLWRDILYAVRLLDTKGVKVTSSTLAEHLNMDTKLASAYLCLMGKWGYVRRASKDTVSGRWCFVWELTRFGLEYKPEKAVRRTARPTLMKIAANPGKKKGV